MTTQIDTVALIGGSSLLLAVGLTILILRERNEQTRTYMSIILGVVLASFLAWYVMPTPALHGGLSAAYSYLRDHPEELEKLKQGASTMGGSR